MRSTLDHPESPSLAGASRQANRNPAAPGAKSPPQRTDNQSAPAPTNTRTPSASPAPPAAPDSPTDTAASPGPSSAAASSAAASSAAGAPAGGAPAGGSTSPTTNEPPEPPDDTHPAANTAANHTHTTRRTDRPHSHPDRPQPTLDTTNLPTPDSPNKLPAERQWASLRF
ncbi:MAG: hypothetical protein OXH20_00425 [bacterium]|nr:hypothetical protein [bacterium]